MKVDPIREHTAGVSHHAPTLSVPPPPRQEAEQEGSALQRWAVLAAIAFFVVLLLAHLDQRELWTDEIISLGHVADTAHFQDPSHPPGYYWLLYGWCQLCGRSDLALRAFSLPWALLAMLLALALARQVLTPSQRALFAWLFAMSPFLLLYLRMGRYFALEMAVALAAALAYVAAIERGRARDYLLASLATAALVYTDYVPLVLLIPLYLALFWAAVRRGGWHPLAAVLVVGLAGALAAPQLRLLAASVGVPGTETLAHLGLSPYGLAMKLALPNWSLTVGETTDFWRWPITVPVLLVGSVAWLTGFWIVPRKSSAHYVVCWAWPMALVMVAALVNLLAPGEPISRNSSLCLFAAPLALMLLAVGLSRLPGPWRLLIVGLYLIAQLYGLGNYFTGQQFLNPNYAVRWREVAAHIQPKLGPRDYVIGYYEGGFFRYWQGPADRAVDFNQTTRPEQLYPLEHFNQLGNRVWLVTRDRGGEAARVISDDLRRRLTSQAGRVEVFSFMPLTPQEQRYRSMMLRRPVWDAYIKVYLFTPTPEGGATARSMDERGAQNLAGAKAGN